jgi:hypothetical protein
VPQGCGQWAVEPSPNPPGSNQNWLNDVAVIAEDDIWAVGRSYGQYTASDWNQTTLAMHFDGSSWTIFPTPNPNPAPRRGSRGATCATPGSAGYRRRPRPLLRSGRRTRSPSSPSGDHRSGPWVSS